MHVTVPTAYRPAGHVCDAECWYARGPATDCVCSCGGECHGIRRTEHPLLTGVAMAAESARSGRDPFARMPVDLDDAPY